MTNCRTSRRAALVLALALSMGAGGAGPAVAQGGGEAAAERPIMLLPPPASGAGRSGADEVTQPPTPAPTGKRATSERGPRSVGGIVIGDLDAPDAEAAGLLDPSSGGFGFDLWAGTPRADVEALLTRLPGVYALPAARDLALRLLLSTAAVPEGEAGLDLLQERMRLLDAMGETANALALAEALPAGVEREQWRRLRVDALLLGGEVDEACAEVGDLARDGGGGYVDHALVACRALAGELEQARLGVDLLAEVGDEDPLLFKIVRGWYALGRDGVDVAALPLDGAVEPYHVALLLALGQPLSAAQVETIVAEGEGRVLQALARAESLPPGTRLPLIEAAARRGLVEGAELATVYLTAAGASDGKREGAEREEAAFARARLYRQAANAAEPGARLEALAALLANARERDPALLLPVAGAAVPLVAKLDVTALPAQTAVAAYRTMLTVFLAAGEGGLAARADADLRVRPEVARAAAADPRLALLAVLAGEGGDAAADGAGVVGITNGGDLPLAATGVARAVLESLDLGAPAMAWAEQGPLLEDARVMTPALWYGIRRAAEGGRVGETVLLSLLALDGEGGVGAAEPLTLGAVLEALRLVGLERDAWRLAVQAVVAAGA